MSAQINGSNSSSTNIPAVQANPPGGAPIHKEKASSSGGAPTVESTQKADKLAVVIKPQAATPAALHKASDIEAYEALFFGGYCSEGIAVNVSFEEFLKWKV